MRLIDADELKEALRISWVRKAKMPMEADPFLTFAMSDIANAPTIDAVEVVRCKECKYWQDNNNGYPHEECRWGKEETPDDNDYCSYGERREDD